MTDKNNSPAKTYKLKDLIGEAQKTKHKIVIETDDGQTFEIDPPELWDDSVFESSGVRSGRRGQGNHGCCPVQEVSQGRRVCDDGCVHHRAAHQGCFFGGIQGLLELVNGHLEAIDYDLTVLGLDLRDAGTVDLPWSRLRAVLSHLPATSAFAQSMYGPSALWSTTEHLLAAVVDTLAAANWQRGGGKGARPKPVRRPGDVAAEGGRRLGTASIPLGGAKAFFDRINRN